MEFTKLRKIEQFYSITPITVDFPSFSRSSIIIYATSCITCNVEILIYPLEHTLLLGLNDVNRTRPVRIAYDRSIHERPYPSVMISFGCEIRSDRFIGFVSRSVRDSWMRSCMSPIERRVVVEFEVPRSRFVGRSFKNGFATTVYRDFYFCRPQRRDLSCVDFVSIIHVDYARNQFEPLLFY